ncbi:MAG: RHS repeat-associated core domain-containing protein, partial [Thermoanaerobaculales bacterium]|nr:RHS repeat-associated core domain-containing protein [Thermoanaerobaculales bacterium]
GSSELDYFHARYYSTALKRFVSVDPVAGTVGSSQSCNRYSYVLNNPIKLVDPDGRETLVFTVAGGNIFQDIFTAQGHSASYVTRDGRAAGISQGTSFGFENGIGGFLEKYASQGREVRMYVLGTSADQDNAMLDFIAANQNGGVDTDSIWRNLLFSRENCTTAVGNVLESGGVVPEGSNPGRGLVADRPANLQRELEGGALSSLVRATVVFEPEKEETLKVQAVNSEVIRVNGKLQFR